MKTVAFPPPLTKSSKTNINQVHETKPGNFIFQSEIFKNLINIIIIIWKIGIKFTSYFSPNENTGFSSTTDEVL